MHIYMHSFDLSHKIYAMWKETPQCDVDNLQTTKYTFTAHGQCRKLRGAM